MKLIALLMILVGLALAAGAILEFRDFGPEDIQFWVGVFTTPAGLFFAIAGLLLWRRGSDAKRIAVAAAIVMLSATVAATALHVMGPPAALMGVIISLTTIGYAWKARAMAG